MRWISYFILAYVTVGVQTGLGRAMQWHEAVPNFVLMAVVFVSMNAPREVGLLGSFILGAMQDLTAQGTVGLYGFSYGIVALFVMAVRQAVYREHPLTHASLALAGGLITAVILALHGWIHPPTPQMAGGEEVHAVRLAISPLFYSALYTAVLAPIVIGFLQRIKTVFQFQTSRGWNISRGR